MLKEQINIHKNLDTISSLHCVFWDLASPYSADRSVAPVYYRKHLKWNMRKGKTQITFTLLHIYPLDITLGNRGDTLYFPYPYQPHEWKRKKNDSHLNVSAWRIWQLAWCSNWSSSHRKFWQKEQRKIRPPIQEVYTVSPDFYLDKCDVARWIFFFFF